MYYKLTNCCIRNYFLPRLSFILPASLSISCSCSPVFINLNFCGTKLHIFIPESLNPVANKLESSDISAAVTLNNNNNNNNVHTYDY